MQSGLICFECMIKKQAKLARAQKDPVKGEAYLRDVLRIIADSPEGISTPGLSNEFAKAFEKYFHVKDRFAQVKKASNAYVMGKAEDTRKSLSLIHICFGEGKGKNIGVYEKARSWYRHQGVI